MSRVRGRISTYRSHKEIFLIPTFGFLDMDASGGPIAPYRFRLAFAFLVWMMSIGLGKKRPRDGRE